MRRRVLAPAVVSAVLLLCGCTATTGSTVVTGSSTTTEAGTTTKSTVVTGPAVALSGRLVGQGVIGIHRIDLPDGSAEEMLGEGDFQAGHTATLQVGGVGGPLLHTAQLPLGPEPLTVRGYRLDGSVEGARVSEYSWPGTELANRVHALAASPDGTHLAALIADGPSTYLEVVDSRTDEVVFSGRDRTDRTLGLVGDDLLWSQEHGLVYVADLGAGPVDSAGGVVGVEVEGLREDTGEVTMSLLVGFDDEAWQAGRPQHLALSPDETQLAYAYVPERPSPPTGSTWPWSSTPPGEAATSTSSRRGVPPRPSSGDGWTRMPRLSRPTPGWTPCWGGCPRRVGQAARRPARWGRSSGRGGRRSGRRRGTARWRRPSS